MFSQQIIPVLGTKKKCDVSINLKSYGFYGLYLESFSCVTIDSLHDYWFETRLLISGKKCESCFMNCQMV